MEQRDNKGGEGGVMESVSFNTIPKLTFFLGLDTLKIVCSGVFETNTVFK